MKTEMNVSGMTCGGCVANVKSALSVMPGVSQVDVSLSKHTAIVEFDDARTSIEAMGTAVRAAGYDVVEAPVTKASGGSCCDS